MKNQIEHLIIKRDEQKNKENRNLFNDEIAFYTRDVNWNIQSNHPILKVAKELNKLTTKIDDVNLTFEQDEIFKKMQKGEDVWISAKTSFGKTWLAYSCFIERINMAQLQKNFRNIIFIHFVPSDIIASQLIYKINEKIEKSFWFSKDKKIVNVSDNFENNCANYLVGTPEKIYPQIEKIFKDKSVYVESIIADEAHEMFLEGERQLFYKTVVERFCKYFPDANIWLIGAFLNNNNKDSFEKKINKKFIDFYPHGFRLRYVINHKNTSWLKSEEINFNKSNDNQKKLILNYFPSVPKCLAAFEREIWNFDYFKTIQRLNRSLDNQKLRDEYFDDYSSKLNLNGSDANKNFNSRYNILDGLRIGVGVYHAQMPEFIKSLVYKFAEENLLDTIYTTPAIIGGLDLKISEINIHETKISTSKMQVSEFFNLAGRAGRYRPKNEQIIATVNIIDNKTNNNWINNNKEKIFSREFNETYKKFNEKNLYNIRESLKVIEDLGESEELKNNIWIDPRIHPEITRILTNNKTKLEQIFKDVKYFFELIKNDKGIRFDDEKPIPKWIRINDLKYLNEFLCLYTEKYRFKSRYKIYQLGYRDIFALRYFFQYIYLKDEYKLFIKYSISLKKREKEIDFSKKMQEFSSMFYQEIKYALYSYFAHFFKLAKRYKITNETLEEIMV